MNLSDRVFSTRIKKVRKKGSGECEVFECEDALLLEEPLRILLNGRDMALLMRTPGNDLELAVGFLLTEGIVSSGADIASVKQCTMDEIAATSGPGNQAGRANVIQIMLVDQAKSRIPSFREVRSSCSLCGEEEIDRVLSYCHFEPGDAGDKTTEGEKDVWTAEELLGLTDVLRDHQPLFHKTGAAHGAAIFDRTGKLLALTEDIGRHNALDKAIGTMVWRGELRNDLAMALSSRISFEMILKVWRSGIRNVAAVSAASSLAVQFARRTNMNMAAFARGNSLNLYR